MSTYRGVNALVGAVNSEYELACAPPFQALTGTLELEHFQIRAAPAPVTRQQHQHQHINCEHWHKRWLVAGRAKTQAWRPQTNNISQNNTI